MCLKENILKHLRDGYLGERKEQKCSTDWPGYRALSNKWKLKKEILQNRSCKIHFTVLKELAEVTAEPLASLFENLWRSGVNSDNWKMANNVHL